MEHAGESGVQHFADVAGMLTKETSKSRKKASRKPCDHIHSALNGYRCELSG